MSEKDYNYIFVGKVIPEFSAQKNSFDVNYTDFQIDFKDENSVVASKINIKLENSILTSKCIFKTEVKNPNNVMSNLKRRLHSIIDVLGYEQGRAYDIDVIVCYDHQNKPFNFWGGALGGFCSPENRQYKSREIVENFYGDSEFGLTFESCFANIREAIRFPHDTPFYCNRAVESLKYHFLRMTYPNKLGSFTKKEQNSGWPIMWESIDFIDEENSDYFKKLGQSVGRHGGHEMISIEERNEMFEKTYNVIDKFLKYAFNEKKI